MGRNNVQEAQLPLRNRASAMHFFVAKLLSVVMTYTYVYHLWNLCLMIWLICRHSGWAFHRQEQSPWGIHCWRFRDPSLHRFDSVPACDRQVDGWTDNPTVTNTGLCWRPVKMYNVKTDWRREMPECWIGQRRLALPSLQHSTCTHEIH